MDRSYPYSRRLVSRARLRKRMAAVASAGLVAAAAVFMLAWKPDPIAATVPSPALPLASLNDAFGAGEPVRPGVRRIYPYSVVPGGVSGQAELKRIIRTDSVVAAHYATFDADKARAVVVDKPRAVHVSYRKGDKVYWTAHKVMLAPGETLLSDGSNEMRARCANRISDIPQYPVEAHHPTMAELDQAVELGEGEEYALGPDGMPVAMGSDGVGRHTVMRYPGHGGSGSGVGGSDGASADGTLGDSLSSSAASTGPVSTLGLSGSSSSIGSRPRPAGRPASTPAAETATPAGAKPVVDPDSATPATESTAPGGQAGTGIPEPTTSPLPATTNTQPIDTTPGSPAAGPSPTPVAEQPADLPLLPERPSTGTDSGGGSSNAPPPNKPDGTGEPPAQPGPATETTDPKPIPEQIPSQTVEQPAPTEVPEPASLWLFGLALAAMAVLRRTRRAN